MSRLSDQLVAKLLAQKISPQPFEVLVDAALREDLGSGLDATTVATIPANQIAVAQFNARKAGVVAGIFVAQAVLEIAGNSAITFAKQIPEGSKVKAGELIFEATGKVTDLLYAERTALNFLSRLSGVATISNIWVEAVKGTGCIIRDTRKTTPGWREIEKFAVRMGGATNHRMNLSDAALIKDNHIAATGSITKAINDVRNKFPNLSIEVEIDHLDQMEEAIAGKVDLILLDNMSPEECKVAVAQCANRTKLEASGGITLENARKYAESGVDFIAIGALTHSAAILDIGLDLQVKGL
ncbi:MAG: carboxylating nicotinate-nucleotide diphosphorylase [Actinomycetes bacterium]